LYTYCQDSVVKEVIVSWTCGLVGRNKKCYRFSWGVTSWIVTTSKIREMGINIMTDLREIVGAGTGSKSCPISGIGISALVALGYITRQLAM
jgi:hypothetical protein